MFGRPSIILAIGLLSLGAIIATALPAMADENYPINQDFKMADSNIVIHIIEVNVTDHYMGNIYPKLPLNQTQWAHLVYQYENTGDDTEVGHIQYALIDSNGNVYPFNPNGTEYSGETVGPHSESIVRWDEIPIPAGTVLTQVHVWEGTNPNLLLANETFNLQQPIVVTPTATPSASPAPTSTILGNYTCCAPFAPLILLGSLAVVGIYSRGKGIKK
jgi:hypothetical protein